MTPATLIEQELTAAQAAQSGSNDGKARVCARRAVAHAIEVWTARLPVLRWSGDALAHLRHIQQDTSFPLLIRQAAEPRALMALLRTLRLDRDIVINVPVKRFQ